MKTEAEVKDAYNVMEKITQMTGDHEVACMAADLMGVLSWVLGDDNQAMFQSLIDNQRKVIQDHLARVARN